MTSTTTSTSKSLLDDELPNPLHRTISHIPSSTPSSTDKVKTGEKLPFSPSSHGPNSPPASASCSSSSSSSSSSFISSSATTNQIQNLHFTKSNINVSLFNQLLDQPNLVEEINAAKNQKLISYISQKDVVSTMFDYILFSIKLSKFTSIDEVPTPYLSHDIFVSTEDPAKSINNSTDDFMDSTSNNETDNENDTMQNNKLDGDEENDHNKEVRKDENMGNNHHNVDILHVALQRAAVISEIMILPSSNIHQTLLSNFDIFTKLWRGFMNNEPHSYFKETKLVLSKDINSVNEDADITLNDDDDDSVFSENIDVKGTDAQKLAEMEESDNYSKLRDPHEVLMFNNFLKFVDDMALINMGSFMNFIRFEQEYYSLTDQFIRFIPYSQTVCDLLVRLISTDKRFNSNGLIDILLDQNLIIKLISTCKKYYLDHQVQDNVCNILNGIVGISSNIGFWEDNSGVNGDDQQDLNSNNPNIGPNDLTRQLVSPECVDEMLDIIINYGNYGLVTIVSVIIEVIRKNNSDYDEFDWISSVNFDDENKSLPNPRDPIYLGNLMKLFSINLDKIVKTYLTDDYYKRNETALRLESSIGQTIEPLGYERFKIMELVAELLHCSNMILMNKSVELDKLIHRRDMLRGDKKKEQLVSDAINELIIDDSHNVKNNRDATNKERGNNDSIPERENSIINSRYFETDSGLSIGNFFKFKLLQTHAIPLIALKLVKFPWNNFMHNVVFDLIQQIFNGRLANWDEDRAINQEETIYDDNLSLNKILIWSLFGEYSNYSNPEDPDDLFYYREYQCSNADYPGFFNLALFIVYCYHLSNRMYDKTNFRFGYMGHLTLIAEEIHKFQSYVENFGVTKNENAFGLRREEEDDIRPFYLKSSYYIFNELYESIFENKGDFKPWLEFVNVELREISSMYNKVLGNPNEVNDEAVDDGQLGLSSEQVISNMDIQEPPKAEGAIILDNGDNEEFRKGSGNSVKDSDGVEGVDENTN